MRPAWDETSPDGGLGAPGVRLGGAALENADAAEATRPATLPTSTWLPPDDLP